MTMAKSLGSGITISGIACKRKLQEGWRTDIHGGTYSGNTMACAAAARGEQLMSALRGLQKKYPVIGDVRGRGCLVASEFMKDGEPDAATTKAVIAAASEENMLMLSCGTYGNVIRWIPSLVITEMK